MINVYVDGVVTGALAEFESETVVSAKKDIRIEFIDTAPLTAEVKYVGENAEISMYVRDEINPNRKMALHGTAKGKKVDADKGDKDTVIIAYTVAEGINKLLQEKGMLDECAALDEDKQGVLFGIDENEDISIKIVEGKKRPALLCTSILCTRMARPYSDEVMKRDAMECMSLEEIEEAANTGDIDAIEMLANAYLHGDAYDVDEDPEKAYYWIVKWAEAGNAEAMYDAGLYAAKGFGTERDFAKAAEWMQKAADEGDKDAEACAKKYRKLADAVAKAEAGDAQAQAELSEGLMELGGSFDEAGEGTYYEESVMWAEKAVAQGCPDGYWTLALAYHHGRGVNGNMDKAIEYYQKGADAGNAPCQYNLGCVYMLGVYCKKDYHKGFELFKAAAEQGYGLAMKELGRCYQLAHGTPCDMKIALEWYEKALEIIDDPELEQKVMNIKMMCDMDEGAEEDYPEEAVSAEATDEYMTGIAPDAVTDAWKYEDELYEAGVLPDEPHGHAAWGDLPRVHKKAEEGDVKAIEILKEWEGLGEDYPEEDEDEGMDKYMTGIAPDAVTDAWKYEDELYKAGMLPDEPYGHAAWGDLPRVNKKAEEGDAKAIKILEKLDALIG